MNNKQMAELIRSKKYQLESDVINNTNYTNYNNNTNNLITTNDFNNYNYPVNLSSPTQAAIAAIEETTNLKESCLVENAKVAPRHIKVDLFGNQQNKEIALKVVVALDYNSIAGPAARFAFHMGKVNKKSRTRDFWRGISKDDKWYQNVMDHLVSILDNTKGQHLDVYPRIGKGYKMQGSATRSKGGTIIEKHTACILWGEYPDDLYCRILIDDMPIIEIEFQSGDLSVKQKKVGQIGTYTNGSAKAYIADGPSITERLLMARLKEEDAQLKQAIESKKK